MQSAFLKGAIGGAFLLSLMVAVGCATTGAPFFAAKAENPVLVPAGSSWVQESQVSGSYGSGTVRQTMRSLGEQTWQGRKVYAYENPQNTLLLDATSMKWVANVKGATTLLSYDPPLGWNFPLWVGQIHTGVFSITNHQSGKTVDIQAQWKIEAVEEINVPAGTFKVFRIAYSDPGHNNISWWSPELGIFIKSKNQRTAEHPMGPGVREMKLISQDIRK